MKVCSVESNSLLSGWVSERTIVVTAAAIVHVDGSCLQFFVFFQFDMMHFNNK